MLVGFHQGSTSHWGFQWCEITSVSKIGRLYLNVTAWKMPKIWDKMLFLFALGFRGCEHNLMNEGQNNITNMCSSLSHTHTHMQRWKSQCNILSEYVIPDSNGWYYNGFVLHDKYAENITSSDHEFMLEETGFYQKKHHTHFPSHASSFSHLTL